MELVKRKDRYDLYADDGRKIASTSPNPMGKLSLKNCQAIERGYDLDELLNNITPKNSTTGNISERIGFVKGFQKALELMEHRLSEETEWDVEIEMKRSQFIVDKLLRNDIKNGFNYTTKLDADGCLILKKI